jgi:hypothetical protein
MNAPQNTSLEILRELREINTEVKKIKSQISGSVAFGVIGAGILLGFIGFLFSL